MRYGDARVTVARLKPLIDCVAVTGHGNRSVVVALCGREGDWSNAPRNSIIRGHDDSLSTIRVAYRVRRSTARVVGHVDGSVGRHFEMAVQATAVGGCVHNCPAAEGESTVIAASAPSIRDALRAVVDRVRINASGRWWWWRHRSLVVRPAADRLVVDVRWQT